MPRRVIITYSCRECWFLYKKQQVCEICWWPVTKDVSMEKRINPMNQEKVIKFLKSQQYKNNHSKIIFKKYADTIDFINKAIPNKNQNRLF